jgi:Flp pilus assembly pilin Flp
MRDVLRQLVEPILSRKDAGNDGEKGQTLAEYALIISFVAMAAVAALTGYGQGLEPIYDRILGIWP